jgi:hypothetical protein
MLQFESQHCKTYVSFVRHIDETFLAFLAFRFQDVPIIVNYICHVTTNILEITGNLKSIKIVS